MTEIYLQLEEAACLEGLNYFTLYRNIKRKPEEYLVKTQPTDGRGKDRLLVALSSLSRKARLEYIKKNNADLENALFEEYASDEKVPWYVEVDLGWYLNRYNKEYLQGIETAGTLTKYFESYQNLTRSQRGALANEYMKKLDMTKRTFYRKVQAYQEASAWAMRMYEEDGCNYDYYTSLAMCSEPIDVDKFPSLSGEMKAFIDNKWYDSKLAKNNLTITMVYDLFIEEASNQNWYRIPSYHAVRRYINKLMETESNAHYLLEKGKREWKRNCMFKGRRDIKSLMVNEIWQGDVHKFDFWAKVIRSNGKETAVKPCLIAWLDMRSRCLVGWAICENPNAQIMKKTIIHAIYPKKDKEFPFEGVCKYLLIDNGKEYTAESLTGRPRKVRVSFDSETKGFYKSIGIEDDIRSKPFEPWSKAQIERLFGTVCEKFSKWFDSYVGTLTGSKTTAKIKKDIPKMLQRNQLISLEDVAEAFEKWLKEGYLVRDHSGLKEQGDDWIKPIEVYTNADKYIKAAPPTDYSLYAMMEVDEALVRNTGIIRFKQRYYNEELGRYIGQKVIIRYDPDDVRTLHCYEQNGKKICEAFLQGLLGMGDRVSEKQMAEHMQMQARQYKNDRDIINYRQTPYDERIELPIDKKVILPELKQEHQKLISMPDDTQYRQEVKNNTNSRRSIKNEYYEKQAKKGLDKIRKLSGGGI